MVLDGKLKFFKMWKGCRCEELEVDPLHIIFLARFSKLSRIGGDDVFLHCLCVTETWHPQHLHYDH